MLRRTYEWTMAKAAHPHAAGWLGLFSFVEASFFPIPPHPLLGLMCLAEPRRAIRFAAIATAASVAGGLLGYAIGYFLYESVGAALLGALHLTEGVAEARCLLNNQPLIVLGLFAAKGMTPIPFKLLTITAGFLQFPLLWFIAASLVSRSLSFMIVGVLFRLFGRPIKAFIDRYLAWVTAGFVLLVIAGFLAITVLGGSGEHAGQTCRSEAVAVAPPG
jgi:membrane protein YqaA with SNARE-associated domain